MAVTSRERVIKALNYEDPDRVGYGHHCLQYSERCSSIKCRLFEAVEEYGSYSIKL
jgi:hypothetical protein